MKKIYFGLILTFLFVQAIFAQNITKQSYEKAREILDKAVTAYGGVDTLRGIQNFTLKAVGDTVQRNQSRKTFAFDRTPYQIDLVVDVKNNRARQTVQGGYPGGFKYHNGFVLDKTDGVALDFIRSTMFPRPNMPPTWMRSRVRYLPQFWIMSMGERSSRLRYVGKADFNGASAFDRELCDRRRRRIFILF